MPSCPACQGELKKQPLYGTEIECCTDCKGTWLEGNDLDAIIDFVRRGFAKDWEKRFEAPPGPRKAGRYCPKCPHSVLLPFMYARDSGIELDRCPRCGGIWFDYGELERVAILVAGLAAPLDLPFF